MRVLVCLLALAAMTAGAVPARAQERQTGTLRVVIKDPSGAVVPGMTPPADRNPDDTHALSEYNERLKRDPRFHTVWLPVGDGVAISIKVSPS